MDAILEAATYILSRSGWSALTTNGIAERAGVNIASLYQYFPNKEAIVAELRRRYLAEVNACGTHGEPPKTLREALQGGVRWLIAEHRTNPELHRVFEEEVPRSHLAVDTGMAPGPTKLWEPALTGGLADLELTEFIARVAARAVVREAVLTRPALLDHPRFEEELVMLLERYVSRPPRKR